jgi:hypothetical protein
MQHWLDVSVNSSHCMIRCRNWSGPVEMPSYINAQKEAYSCVAGNVACNAAPAVPSPADSWHGPNNA